MSLLAVATLLASNPLLAQDSVVTPEIEPWVTRSTSIGFIVGVIVFGGAVAWHYGPKLLADMKEYSRPDAVASRAEAEAAQAAAEAEAAL